MRNIWIFGLSGIAIAGGLIIWGLASSETPEWKEMQQLQDELRTSMESEREDNSDEAKENRETLRWGKMAEYREKLEALPEKLQKTAREQMRGMFVSRMEERIDRVLLLPPEERNEELDKQIDEWDRRLAARGKRKPQDNPKSEDKNGDGQAGNADGNGDSTNAAESEKKKSGRHWRSRWANASKEQRDTWRRELLSRTTPEQRAKWHEYRRLMDQRRKERGLSARSF